MEDWQEWQIRADQIAVELGADIDKLERDFFPSTEGEINFRAFWPRFRDLKEKVRTAPAIRLEDKLSLERRLRPLGGKAYKSQEAAFARSTERKNELMVQIGALRSTAESESSPRALRNMRRDFDQIRESFDKGPALAPADRQAVWESWREANQFAWQRLQDLWSANEAVLREVLAEARQELDRGNANAVRQTAGRFFEALKSHEAKQESINAMKAEVDAMRREAEALEDRKATVHVPPPKASTVPATTVWRDEILRNRESLSRLQEEVAGIESQIAASDSLLEQAMVRGTLVDKKRKLAEIEHANRSLEQKLAQAEDSPVLSVG